MQLTVGSPAGRYHSKGSDPLGKFAWTTLRGRNDNKLCVVTAYRVCQKKGTRPPAGDNNTSHWQLVKAMVRRGVKDPDPRTQVLNDLSKLIQSKRDEGCEIVLMIDANEDGVEGTDLRHFVRANSLHDVHETLLSRLPRTTRHRSNRRIDFM